VPSATSRCAGFSIRLRRGQDESPGPPRHTVSMPSSMDLRRALRTLQGRMRQSPDADDPIVTTVRDARGGEAVDIPVTANRHDAMEAAKEAIADDLHFEHLDPADNEVNEFVADCVRDRASDHVGPFMDRYSEELVERTCYFSVEALSVQAPSEFCGMQLIPIDSPEIPDLLRKTDPAAQVVAAVPVTGSGIVAMTARARRQAQHALRVLRVALRQEMGGSASDSQLRFRLGIGHAFSDRAGGWQVHDDIAYRTELPADLTRYQAPPVARLPMTASRGSIEEKALLALGWLDRAVFTPDPLVATLFRFFALEALLGDRSEGLKSGLLALRQMTLSRLATGYFRHPDDTLLQYDEVRSYAVHGEITEDISPEQAGQFEWAVRDTFSQYLDFARQHGIARRSELTGLLDADPIRADLIEWIRANGSSEWAAYLDRIQPNSAGMPE
jgi:hypothetical protein